MSGKAKGAKTCVRGHTFLFRTLTPPLFLSSFRDFVFGLGPWSWVVLKDKITVLGPGLGLEPSVLGPGLGLGLEGLVFGPVLGLETTVQSIALNYIHQCHWLSCSL